MAAGNTQKQMIKKLFIMQLHNNGIPEEGYHFLSKEEKAMLRQEGERFFLKDEFRKKIKVVLSGGVFDILHIGHLYTLKEASKHGDVLVVAIAKDQHIEKKKRKPIHSQEYRLAMVEFLKPVDIALLGMDKPEDLLEYVRPDVLVYGYDQEPFLKPDGVDVVKLDKQIDDKKFKTSRILTELGL
jgi:cytidyltransferase-like protein